MNRSAVKTHPHSNRKLILEDEGIKAVAIQVKKSDLEKGLLKANWPLNQAYH